MYLVVVLLGHQPALPQHQVEGGGGHERPVAQVPEHDGEQEGEGDDGEWRWRQGGDGGGVAGCNGPQQQQQMTSDES